APPWNPCCGAFIAPSATSAKRPTIATPAAGGMPSWRNYAGGSRRPSSARTTKKPPGSETSCERRKPRMNLDELTTTSDEWLRGTGPESDIVLPSRIRLARNLAAFPYTNRASGYQKAEIEAMLRDRIGKLDLEPKLGYLNVPGLSTLDRQFLVERQLISR